MTFADHYATKERWAAEYARLHKIGNRKDAKHAWERMHAANMALMQMSIRSKGDRPMKQITLPWPADPLRSNTRAHWGAHG